MEVFQLVAVALSFMVALTCSWAVLKPFFDDESRLALDRDALTFADLKRAEELVLRKERVFEELEDLEVDHLSARVAADDYALARRELDAEAVTVMSELDRLQGDRLQGTGVSERGTSPKLEKGPERTPK